MADIAYLWTWGGQFFGYRRGDYLFTHNGVGIGRFHGDEVYGPDGHYLGEIKSGNRLIVNSQKKGWVKGASAIPAGSPCGLYAAYAGFAMYAGHEDFPSPDHFGR